MASYTASLTLLISTKSTEWRLAMSNTLDERETPIALLLEEAWQLGNYNIKDGSLIPLLKQAKALIAEARIDEVKRIDPTSNYVLNDLVMSVGDRLTQLKENK